MADQNKVAIVTGAGSGIGEATALALLAEGYHVSLAGRRKDQLERVAQPRRARTTIAGARGAHGRGGPRLDPEPLRAHQGGVRAARPPLQQRRHRRARHPHGGPHATSSGRPWWTRTSPARFICTQEAIKIMKDQTPRGGRIINNGSISAHAPRPNSVAYTSTKHAITGLTKSTSLDGRKYDIACGQIDIGNALTPLAARMSQGVPQANGTVAPEPLFDVQARGRRRRRHGQAAAGYQRAVHDHHGDEDALRGTGLRRAVSREARRPALWRARRRASRTARGGCRAGRRRGSGAWARRASA